MNRNPESKIILWEALPSFVERLRGSQIVTTNGCFDILHWGHIKYLHEAKRLGDLLLCGVNSDASVKTLGKGDDRPIHGEMTRALQVAGLESVDYVFVFDQKTPETFLEIVKPQIHVKGADYATKPIPERAVVEKNGGRIELIAFVPGFSTTSLLQKVPRTS